MSSEIININQLNDLKDLLEEEFVPLIQEYLRDSEQKLDQIAEALVTGDNAAGYNAVHSLKGASANVGATQLTELCFQLQQACREARMGSQKALVDQIISAQLQVSAYLRQSIQ